MFALFGVGLTVITGNPLFDAIGTLMIGTLLIVIAIVLGIETKSLLVGEGATDADHAADRRRHHERRPRSRSSSTSRRSTSARTSCSSPRSSASPPTARSPPSRPTSTSSRARIRDAVPTARVIYLEPDIYRPDDDPAPPTEEFVIRSLD